MRDDYAIDRIADATTYDSEGEKVGTAGRVFTDSEGGDPTFVAVNTGLFGMSETIVPLAGARMKGEELHLEYTKEQIKDAPRIDEDGELSSSEEDRLYSHYGLPEPEGDEAPSGEGEAADSGDADDAEADIEKAGTGADTGVGETAKPGSDTEGADTGAVDRSPGAADEGPPSEAPRRQRLRAYSAPE